MQIGGKRTALGVALYVAAALSVALAIASHFIPKPVRKLSQEEARLGLARAALPVLEQRAHASGKPEDGQELARVKDRIKELEALVAAQPAAPEPPLWRALATASWFPLAMLVLAGICGRLGNRALAEPRSSVP
jgi:hypothetical protein